LPKITQTYPGCEEEARETETERDGTTTSWPSKKRCTSYWRRSQWGRPTCICYAIRYGIGYTDREFVTQVRKNLLSAYLEVKRSKVKVTRPTNARQW